ncbi:GntR family transcriptional regulator [Anaerocolumna sedimenticola]|uniref:GntR family transcriptional regulator n=1 Tax=Anaerocolumna sedimenticola TaxID=2696063 RepID=A0A6P1TND7_9FIRM|nr:GntR family transcriptional regulator [Anaerocolumna sedimenticola]QHQ61702.1 GntR family transcriptional regulator [Anaerocolumna sedimenticola]
MVAQKIRDDIMNRTLKSGDKIKKVELSKQLNISRMPVREVFHILQSVGLVSHNPILEEQLKELKNVQKRLERYGELKNNLS